MDERLLGYYNTELHYLRESGREFAQRHKKIAGRLYLDKEGDECPDPYVERLLEGFAFLAGRIHQRLDGEFSRFTQGILETVFPDFLCPVPAMCIVRFEPGEMDPGLTTGLRIGRANTQLRAVPARGDRTGCTFTTAHDVTVYPISINEIRYFARNLGELGIELPAKTAAAVRIRLKRNGAIPWPEILAASLTFYLRGPGDFPDRLYEQIFSAGNGVVISSGKAKILNLAKSAILPIGFEPEEALLPPSARTFDGYRLLREYFAFPQRFHFVKIDGLRPAFLAAKGEFLDLHILFDRPYPQFEQIDRMDQKVFELHCTPAINLFVRDLAHLHIIERTHEYQLIGDRHQPVDFEIHSIDEDGRDEQGSLREAPVLGYSEAGSKPQVFRPFHTARDGDLETEGAFYSVNRIPRMRSPKEQHGGDYVGTECYLSMVDAVRAPYSSNLKEIGIRARCTNRHLPLRMPRQLSEASSDFTLNTNNQIGVRILGSISPPRPSMVLQGKLNQNPNTPLGRYAWRLVSLLSLNYLTLSDSQRGTGSAALRELLELTADTTKSDATKMIRSITDVQCEPIIRRVGFAAQSGFARGLKVDLTVNEEGFEGVGAFVFGAVMERFFSKFVSMNSFVETVLHSTQRKKLHQWPARIGRTSLI